MNNIHVFKDEKERSNDTKYDVSWRNVYAQRFTNIAYIYRPVIDIDLQKQGIDTIIKFKDRSEIRIDEKLLRNSYPHISLEVKHTLGEDIHSQKMPNHDAWMTKTMHCHYIAYAFEPTFTVYFLEWTALKKSFELNKYRWFEKCQNGTDNHRVVSVRNKTYTTHSLAIPIDELYKAIQSVNTVSISAKIIAPILYRKDTP